MVSEIAGRDMKGRRVGRSPVRRKGRNGRRVEESLLKGRINVRRGGKIGGRWSPMGSREKVRRVVVGAVVVVVLGEASDVSGCI